MKKFIAIYSTALTLTEPIEAEDEEDAENKAYERLEEMYKEGPFDGSDNVQISIISADKPDVKYGGLTG